MRIQKIFLDAFGPFTGCSIDLSAGKEGFHIIYGPNESGKSSALRAVTQLFFGIPARSTDDFIHNYNMMRIGGSISDDSKTLDFVRYKGTKGTLRDRDDNKILDESSLDVFLGGMDQVTFTTVFGLDHERLVEGGQTIVKGEGNVGEALFAASAGIGDLRSVLENLQDEAGKLFKPKGSKPIINEAISDLRKVRKNLKTAQLRPHDWSEKDKELRQTIENRDEIERNKSILQTERNRLSRILKASPVVTRYFEVAEQLRQVADAPVLPDDFGEQVRALLREKTQVTRKEKEACNELADIEEEMENLTVNAAVLEQEAGIESLNEMYAANRKALKDSIKLKSELEILENQGAKALELFRPGMNLRDVMSLRITPPLRQRIMDLGQKSESVRSRYENAAAALEKLRIARRGIADSLAKIEMVSDPVELERTVRRIRKTGDIEERLREKQKEAGLIEKEISTDISRLGLWEGSMDDLETLPVPSQETIDHFRNEFDRLVNQIKVSRERKNETEEKLREIEEQIAALKREHDIPTEQLLGEYRDVRNDCWRLVRREWENGIPPGKIHLEDICDTLAKLGIAEETVENLADAYESINSETDRVSDRLRGEADRVASLAQLEAGMMSLQGKAADLSAECDRIDNEYEKCSKTWAELWNSLDIQPRSPKEMDAWAQRQRELVKKISGYRSATAEIEQFSTDIMRYSEELGTALSTLGEPKNREGESLAALLDRAEDTVSSFNKTIGERKQLEEKLESIDAIQMPEAEREVAESRESMTAWENDWAETMDVLGENKNTSPGEANAIVQQIDEIRAKNEKIDELKNRIDQIVKDDREFRQNVKDLAAVVAMDCGNMSEEQISQKLYNELKQNRENKSRFEALDRQSDEARKRLGDAKAEMTRIEETLDGLCREAHVSNTDELQPAWERSLRRRKFENEIEDIEERLTELSSGHTLKEFIETVKNEDIDALEPELSQLDEKIQQHEEELKAVSEKIGSLTIELERMDGSAVAARLEEDAQALLAEISMNAEQYARLKISEAVLCRAIEQFRIKNQGPLLRRAGEIFSRLTLESFEGLMTDFGSRDEDILVGVRPGGMERVPVSGMSDGTADQLYLALRLASLERYFDNHPQVPFILDDILVNFDNERAAASLEVLADLSRHTQVIFFTHHRHIVEIARKNVNDSVLFTHELRGAL